MEKKAIVAKAKDVGKKVSDNVKSNPIPYLKVGGVVIGAFLIYKLVSGVADKISNPGDSNLDLEVDGTGGSTDGATISNALANNYAQTLLDAFNSKEPMYGTDEAAVEAVFLKIKNSADFIKIFKAFGSKDYNGHNSPPNGAWSWLDSYEKRNLVYWLRSEIDADDDAELYALVANVVNNAGFAF